MDRHCANSLRSARRLTVALALAVSVVLASGPLSGQGAAPGKPAAESKTAPATAPALKSAVPAPKSAAPAKPMQVAKGHQRGHDTLRTNDDPGDCVQFAPPERSFMKTLHSAETLVNRERYSDAVEYLGKLLKVPEDYLVPKEENGPTYHGLKSEVVGLIGQMPKKGRQLYDMFCGRDAQHLLDDALATGDVSKLARVAGRYFHTEAGYEATFLLGLNYLDHGSSLAAARRCGSSRTSPTPRIVSSRPLTLALASAWLQLGDQDKARDVPWPARSSVRRWS